MSSSHNHLESVEAIPLLSLAPEGSHWYAIHTMARHEKRVVGQLDENRVFSFLPLLQEMHRWSDRQSKVEVPMFSCYAFVRIVPSAQTRAAILRIPGVIGFVGSEGQGTTIPDEEIENLRTAAKEKVPCFPHPFVSSGNRVRIRGGSLDGIEGILMRKSGEQILVVSVELFQRSVAMRVEGYRVEAV